MVERSVETRERMADIVLQARHDDAGITPGGEFAGDTGPPDGHDG